MNEQCNHALGSDSGDYATCPKCGKQRQMYYQLGGGLSLEPGVIDRAFVLRLYAIHEKIAKAALDFNSKLAVLGTLGMMADFTRIGNELDYELDQLERVFGEVLTDAERGLMTDEELAKVFKSGPPFAGIVGDQDASDEAIEEARLSDEENRRKERAKIVAEYHAPVAMGENLTDEQYKERKVRR